MSGGVDSSVAAALLVEAGHDVTGVTLKLWGGESDTGCCSVADVDDARRVAHQLGIDHHVFNFGDEFEARVVDPYVRAHTRGTTPNPCVECNRHVKFDKLLRRADALGFDHIATGHHARVVHGADGLRRVARGADRDKDQSYVVSMLRQEHLRRVLFPVGSITKDEVRRTARTLGLRTAAKPDSQDVCFVASTVGRRRFLDRRVPLHAARVVDTDGVEVGRVDAVELVTVGQRRGLGLAGGDGAARYAVDVDVARRTVVVGTVDDLLVDVTPIERVTWSGDAVAADLDVLVQCSAHGAGRPARIDDRSGLVRWTTPQRKVAPGQTVAFYVDDVVVGSAVVSAGASVPR
jgi:tRNA-specific 2-thiouridylase